MTLVRVLIRPKAGILDPQGEAVKGALPALGFSGVHDVRIGRLVELEVEDVDQVDALCRRLLANPLIEDYEVLEAPGVGDLDDGLGAHGEQVGGG